jgi:uncharacterized protein
MDLVLYHGSCPDGWVAAYVASKRYPEAKLVAMHHGADHTEILKECVHKDVLMVDFSLRTREENDLLAVSTRSFQIYDHHKSAQAVLEGAPYAIFDMKRSGAGLAWDYLFGKDAEDLMYRDGSNFQEPRPWYVDYVEDRDLWNWALPNSKEICAYLGTLEMTKADWEPLDNMEWAAAIGQGIGALAHINHYVREAVKQAQVGILQGYKTAVVNALYLNCSEIGNELAKTHDVSLTWFERADGMIQFSLRSIGDIDVSKIAQVFRGGGHKNAAGFQFSLEYGRQLIDRILGRANEDPQAI